MDSSDEETETEYCSNCKRDIPAINFIMHQPHCTRNIILCTKCNEPVPRTEMDAHHEEYHVLVLCECGESFEREDLEEHKANSCKLRVTKCQYCEIELAFEKMAEHSDFCGSRTEKCPKCHQFVKLRDQAVHEVNGCQTAQPDRKKLNPPVFGGNPFFQQPLINGFPMEDLLSDRAPEPMPRPLYFRPTAMEELDSEPMIGQRRSKKNETTQKHNQKNERSARARNSSVDEADVAHSARQQEEEDLRLALQLAHQEVEQDGPSLHPRLRHTSVDLSPESLYQQVVESRTNQSRESFPDPSAGLESSEVKIPCEVCDQLISLAGLEMHQVQCLQRRTINDGLTPPLSDSDEDGIIDYVGRRNLAALVSPVAGDFPLNNLRRSPPVHPFGHLEDMVPMAMGSERNSDGRNDSPIPDAEVSLVPCEFCKDQFPFVSIALHQASCDNAPQNRDIGEDMREYGFSDRQGMDDSPVPFSIPGEDLTGSTALPLSALSQSRAPPSRQPDQSGYIFGNPYLSEDTLDHVFGAGMPANQQRALFGGPKEENGLGTQTKPSNPPLGRTKPSNHRQERREHQVGTTGAAGVAHSHVVKSRTVPAAVRVPEPTRSRKHQPDPDFNDLETWNKADKDCKVNIVSQQKTANMLQKSAQGKPQNKVYPSSQSLPANSALSSPVLRPSLNSAFNRPAARVVSSEKTSNMQKELHNGGFKGRGTSSVNSLSVESGARGRQSPYEHQQKRTCDTRQGKVPNVSGASRELKTVKMLEGAQLPRNVGLTSPNSLGHGVKRTSAANSSKVSNIGVVSKQKTSRMLEDGGYKYSITERTSDGSGQRSQSTQNNARAHRVKGAGDYNSKANGAVKNGFELSSEIIRSRGNMPSGSSPVMSGSESNRGEADPSNRQSSAGTSSSNSEDYSWESILGAIPIERKTGTKTKQQRGFIQPDAQKQSLQRTAAQPVRTTEHSHPRITETRSTLSLSNLSPSEPLPKSLQVTGSSPSTTGKKVNGETSTRCPTANTTSGTRRASKPDDDFLQNCIAGTQDLMSNGTRSSDGAPRGKGCDGRPNRGVAGPGDNIQHYRDTTGPRCSANFGESRPHPHPRGGSRPRRGHRGGSCRNAQRK